MQHGAFTPGEIGLCFPHEIDKGDFQIAGFLQALLRRPGNASMHIGRQRHIVGDKTQVVQVVHGAANLRRVQAGNAHQFIGRNTLVRVRSDQRFHQEQQCAPAGFRQVFPGVQPGGALHPRIAPATTRETPSTRFSSRLRRAASSSQATAVFTRVSSVALSPPERVVFIFKQNFSGRRHYFTPGLMFAVRLTQRAEDAVNFAPVEAGPRRHAELPLNVVRGVEQYATRGLTIPARPPRFLQVVLQRPRDISVNHQPHIGFVNAHAERVGGRNYPQFPVYETLLGVFPGLRRQPCVIVRGRQLLAAQIFSNIFTLAAGRAIDDGAAGFSRRQVSREHLVDIVKFAWRVGRNYDKIEILSPSSSVEDGQLDSEFLAKVRLNFRHHARVLP